MIIQIIYARFKGSRCDFPATSYTSPLLSKLKTQQKLAVLSKLQGSLHLVQNGPGEFVGCSLSTHVTRPRVAIEISQSVRMLL